MTETTITVPSLDEIYHEKHSLLPPSECDAEGMYLCKCPMCGTTLDIDTHIFCLENTNEDKPDMTICSDCFQSEEEWLVKEGFYDADDGEDSEGWGEDYGFVHPYASQSDEE